MLVVFVIKFINFIICVLLTWSQLRFSSSLSSYVQRRWRSDWSPDKEAFQLEHQWSRRLNLHLFLEPIVCHQEPEQNRKEIESIT